MNYTIFQVTESGDIVMHSNKTAAEVDEMLEFHESSFLEFPDDDGYRTMEHNQQIFIAVEQTEVDGVDQPRHTVEMHIHTCEAFFDDLADEPCDSPLYQRTQHELDQWIHVRDNMLPTGNIS